MEFVLVPVDTDFLVCLSSEFGRDYNGSFFGLKYQTGLSLFLFSLKDQMIIFYL